MDEVERAWCRGYDRGYARGYAAAADVLGQVKSKKVYLAGPMRGVPEFNYPTFASAAYKLRARGYTVFSPAEADIKRLGRDVSAEFPTGDADAFAKKYGITIRECLAEDIAWICKEADEIAFLPGWQRSLGATAERAVAIALGLTIMEIGNG
jgi:hypothetical protein